MRISDWSSDVCSSDLLAAGLAVAVDAGEDRRHALHHPRQVEPGGRFGAVQEGVGMGVRIDEAWSDDQTACVDHLRTLVRVPGCAANIDDRSEEHTSELQSLMRISYAVFCLKKKTKTTQQTVRNRRTRVYQN